MVQQASVIRFTRLMALIAALVTIMLCHMPVASATTAQPAPVANRHASVALLSAATAPQTIVQTAAAVTPLPAAPVPTYTVIAGDSLSAIAGKLHDGNTWQTLCGRNQPLITDCDTIRIGWVLQTTGEIKSLPAAAQPAPSAPVRSTTASAPAVSPAPASSSAAQKAVAVALAQRGKPYVYGAAGPNTFDCSGLVMYAYAAAGINLPHGSAAQRSVTRSISRAELQPGDLIFLSGASGVYHVGMYIGNSEVVYAPTEGETVKVTSINISFWEVGASYGRVV